MTLPLPEFRVTRVSAVEAAIGAKRDNSTGRFLAGGTDLIVNMRRGLGAPPLLIDLAGIDVMKTMTTASDGARIGACVTLSEVASSPALAATYHAVVEAAAAIAGPGIRSTATVGGNLCLDTRCLYYNQSEWWRHANKYCLKHGGETCHVAPQGQRCHAAFSGDLAPAFLVLGAEVDIAGPDGYRRIPLSALYLEDGRGHLALGENELLVTVNLPPNPPASAYAKVRTRGAIDFPLAGVAVALAVAKGKLSSLRVALTGTNSRPFQLEGVETLIGRAIDEEALDRLDKLVQKQVQPMRTTVASAHYRRLAASALARRLTRDLYAAAELKS